MAADGTASGGTASGGSAGASERTARRRLLGMMGFAAGTAAAAPAAAITVDGGRAGLPAQAESEAEKRKPRYRETEHVRAFYRTNRS